MRRPKKANHPGTNQPPSPGKHSQKLAPSSIATPRDSCRVTLAELAHESDLLSETIRAIEAGQGDPRASTLEALAAVMRIDIREWMHDQANAEEKIRYLGNARTADRSTQCQTNGSPGRRRQPDQGIQRECCPPRWRSTRLCSALRAQDGNQPSRSNHCTWQNLRPVNKCRELSRCAPRTANQISERFRLPGYSGQARQF